MATPLQVGISVADPINGTSAALGGKNIFGGSSSGQSSWQSGSGFNGMSPEEIATLLGTSIGQIGYDSNKKGSFEGTYNSYLEQLTPDLLVKRYETLNDSNNFQTPLDQLQKKAYDTAKSILGREVSGAEFAQILPTFQGPNGLVNGRAYLANLAQQYKSNPALDPYSQQNKITDEDIQGSVNQQFQSILGRAATADELSHFTNAIRQNQTDAYGLGSYLKQMPEYTNTQDKKFRESLSSELEGYDTDAFNRQKGDIISAYGKAGMAAGSSPSLDYALTDLMGQIAKTRGSYLAQLSAEQYGGNKDLAVGNYQNTLDQMYQNNRMNTTNQMNYNQQLLDRGFGAADYQTQMNDYMNYLNANKGKSSNPMYGAIGGLFGAGIGSFGGPAGATAGYQIGSGAGNLYGYLNQ